MVRAADFATRIISGADGTRAQLLLAASVLARVPPARTVDTDNEVTDDHSRTRVRPFGHEMVDRPGNPHDHGRRSRDHPPVGSWYRGDHPHRMAPHCERDPAHHLRVECRANTGSDLGIARGARLPRYRTLRAGTSRHGARWAHARTRRLSVRRSDSGVHPVVPAAHGTGRRVVSVRRHHLTRHRADDLGDMAVEHRMGAWYAGGRDHVRAWH